MAALFGLGSGSGLAQTVVAQESWANADHGVQVLTRGPVHEAFVGTVVFDPEQGIDIGRAPPDPIEELPPDQRPDGANVDWIPGYWAWDDERDDFLWVSGVWRALPPGREWVPGYWGRSARGYQWIPGYWADAQRDEIEYLPEPPATVEVGPNVSPPSPDHVWIPGSWVWYRGQYAWRPGYWMLVQADWDWVPSHYVYAPRGYVYVDGYWDHSLALRGVMYAPVHFDEAVYARRGFSYSPATVINLSVVTDHLFVRPRYNHYYFGDYYAPSYRESGFFASFSFHSGRRGYDPIYAGQRWQHRQDADWGRRVEAEFSYRRDHEDARPRRTLAAQMSYTRNEARPGQRSLALGDSVERYSRRPDNRIRFKSVNADERQRLVHRGKEVQRFREERQRVENAGRDASDENRVQRSEPLRMKLRRSPIADKPGEQVGRDRSPPRRPEPPQPDPRVERKQRKVNESKERPGKP